MITDIMLESPHVVVGAAIAASVINPLLALPIAFGSHFLLEKVPHWNPHINTEINKYGKITNKSIKIIAIDSALAFVLGSTIAYSALPNTALAITILLSCFCAVLPDLIEAPYFFLKKKSKFIQNKWMPFKKSIQEDTTPIPGLATQLITILVALYWIYS